MEPSFRCQVCLVLPANLLGVHLWRHFAVRDQSGKPLGYCFLLSLVCFRLFSHYIYKLTLLLDPFYVSPLRQPLYQH